MKNKNIKELLLIAKELDKRSLFHESDIIYKLAADIINFEERASALRGSEDSAEPVEQDELAEVIRFPESQSGRLKVYLGDYEENEIEAALELIETHLDPDANIDEHYGEHDPILGSTLRDFAVNDPRSAVLDPIKTCSPDFANLNARPLPSGPVPPRKPSIFALLFLSLECYLMD